MARPTVQRRIAGFPGSEDPGANPAIKTFWDQPEGTDLVTQTSRIGPNKTPYSKNLIVSTSNRFETRQAASQLGTLFADPIVGLVAATNETGVDSRVVVTTTGVFVYRGGIWTALAGPVLDIPQYSYVEFTSWGGDLLFQDTVTGVYTVDLDAGTYSLIAGSPIGKHLTSFGGRVIVSNLVGLPSRIQWSAKNSSTDWVGEGSGFEDMLSAPGGIVDIQHGVYPINDNEALVIRAGSTWVMSLTGFADAPFSFAYRFNEGTDSPYSIIRIPGQGVVMLGRDDVMMVGTSGIERLGASIRNQLLSSSVQVRKAVAAMDYRRMVYKIHVPPQTNGTTSTVWEYHFYTKSWYAQIYPTRIKTFASSNVQRYLTIGELTGTIGSLIGPIGDLGVLGRVAGSMYAHWGQGVTEDSSTAVVDGTYAGTTQAVSIELQSGLVQPGGPLNKAELIHLQFEYTSTRAMTGLVYVSDDGGTTWESYGTITMPISVVPKVVIFRNTIARKQYQFKLSIADAIGLQLIAAHAYGTPGAPINL